jgi:hypothetical protein
MHATHWLENPYKEEKNKETYECISNACREIWCEQIGTNIPEEPVVHLLEY